MKKIGLGGLIFIDRVLKIIYFQTYVVEDSNPSQKGFLIIFSIVMITLLKNGLSNKAQKLWYYLMVIGAVSNLLDLILYKRVVDYFLLFNYFSNFADLLVSVGIVLLIYELYHVYKNDLKS